SVLLRCSVGVGAHLVPVRLGPVGVVCRVGLCAPPFVPDVCGDGFDCGMHLCVELVVLPLESEYPVLSCGTHGLVDEVVGDHASPTSRPSTASTALIRASLTLICSSASSAAPRSSSAVCRHSSRDASAWSARRFSSSHERSAL